VGGWVGGGGGWGLGGYVSGLWSHCWWLVCMCGVRVRVGVASQARGGMCMHMELQCSASCGVRSRAGGALEARCMDCPTSTGRPPYVSKCKEKRLDFPLLAW
jgi:hypothetical protein